MLDGERPSELGVRAAVDLSGATDRSGHGLSPPVGAATVGGLTAPMRAALLHAYGPPENLVIEEVPDPQPKPHQIVIDVHACGVNFPDVLMVQDLYQFKPALPFTPGGEVSGTVAAVGSDVTDWAVGDRVAAGTGTGGFAEQVVVDGSKAYRLPDGVDLTAAAGFLTTYGTSYHALKDRADIQPGESLLVLGAAGGVGLAAVELGAVMGAHVIAAASSDEKLEACRRFGAAETVNYADVDLKAWLKEHTGGKGVDVVYDPVGGALERAGAAQHGLEGPLPGDRVRRRRHPPRAAEPAAAQGVLDHRRVLRRARHAQPPRAARAGRRADRHARRGPDQPVGHRPVHAGAVVRRAPRADGPQGRRQGRRPAAGADLASSSPDIGRTATDVRGTLGVSRSRGSRRWCGRSCP